jgi:hypothetical protein
MTRFARNPLCLLPALLLVMASLILSTTPVYADAPAGAAYVPYAPTRLVDTRVGLGIGSKLTAFVPATFAVAGVMGIPADAVGVTGNLTVTGQNGAGWLALTSTPVANPGTSTINFPASDTRANGVFASLSGGGLSLTASVATQAIFDVTGYFVTGNGSTYVPFGPTRFLDTRSGTGLAGAFSSHVARSLAIAGVNGIPAGASAITGNIVAVASTSVGYLSVTQNPIASPGTSSLNFPASDIRANNFTVALAGNGSIGITYVGVNGTTSQVVLDVTGYFMPDQTGARYFPIAPVRSADSRSNNGLNGPIGAGSAPTLQVTGRNGIPAEAQAITANLAAISGPAGGYASITPIATNTPTTSSLNFPAHDIRANGFVVQVSSVGTIGLTDSTAPGTSDFVIDITGYFAGGAAIAPIAVPAYSGMNLYLNTAWSHQATSSWCTGASTQMMLNLVTGASDHSSANQGTYVSYAINHSIYVAKSAGAEGDGWANALTAYGAGKYSITGYPTVAAALKAAATRMRVTGKPVGLVVMEGHHAWVMAGFTSSGDDPSVSQNFTLTSVIIMAPDYGSISYDPAPGSAESMSYMATKLTGYTDDFPTIWDHQFVIIQP